MMFSGNFLVSNALNMQKISLLVVQVFLLSSVSLMFGQTHTAGVQFGDMYQGGNAYHLEYTDGDVEESRPRLTNLTAGLFLERHKGGLYYRISADVIVDRRREDNHYLFNDITYLDLNYQFGKMGGIVGIEMGKRWELADRLSIRAGVVASYRTMFPGEGSQHEELYVSDVLTSVYDVTLSDGSEHEAWLGISLRLHYELNKRLSLGLATRYDLRLLLSQQNEVRHVVHSDGSGNILEEKTFTNSYNNKTLTLGDRVVPTLTLGWNFGQ
jgi:hypothetical protein